MIKPRKGEKIDENIKIYTTYYYINTLSTSLIYRHKTSIYITIIISQFNSTCTFI